MPVDRITISIPEDLAMRLRRQTDHDDVSVSAWVARAIERQLGRDGLAGVIADYETENGAFTSDERAEAEQWLGW